MSESQPPEAAEFDAHQPIGRGTAGLSILLSALWGGTPVAISYSVDTLPPVAVSGIRFLLAAAFMYIWCRVEGAGLRLRKGQLVPSMILGALLFAQITLFTVGIAESNSSHGTLFINTFIFWVAIIEHFVTRTVRLPLSRWFGLSVAAAGILLILVATGEEDRGTAAKTAVSRANSAAVVAPRMNRDEPTLKGDVILLISGFLLGVKFVYTKAATRRVEPGKLIFWHDIFGMALFAPWSLSFERTTLEQFTLPAVLGILYQGVVVAGFCFAAQAYLLRKHSASQLSVFSFATPLFGIAISVALRGDPLSPWLLVAGACVAIGILIVTRPLPEKNRNSSADSQKKQDATVVSREST